ncbi:MAG: hypothetical protein O2887_09545 [Bacteroidetes bacterium]|nr:hypothetical protein [Bacteroidota bacterium]MDA1120714.1 hypothetical protein [Bacteroidota bacterium]
MTPQIEKLYKEYKRIRPVKIDVQQFTYLVNLFPAMMVVMSDDVLDTTEWEAVKSLARAMAQSLPEEQLDPEEQEGLERVFVTEFRYLLDNTERWKSKFLNVLSDLVKENNQNKEFVLESMYLFANASDGISSEEQAAINDLSKRLNLEY